MGWNCRDSLFSRDPVSSVRMTDATDSRIQEQLTEGLVLPDPIEAVPDPQAGDDLLLPFCGPEGNERLRNLGN